MNRFWKWLTRKKSHKFIDIGNGSHRCINCFVVVRGTPGMYFSVGSEVPVDCKGRGK